MLVILPILISVHSVQSGYEKSRQDLWWNRAANDHPMTIHDRSERLRRDYIHLYSNQSVYLMMAGLKNKA